MSCLVLIISSIYLQSFLPLFYFPLFPLYLSSPLLYSLLTYLLLLSTQLNSTQLSSFFNQSPVCFLLFSSNSTQLNSILLFNFLHSLTQCNNVFLNFPPISYFTSNFPYSFYLFFTLNFPYFSFHPIPSLRSSQLFQINPNLFFFPSNPSYFLPHLFLPISSLSIQFLPFSSIFQPILFLFIPFSFHQFFLKLFPSPFLYIYIVFILYYLFIYFYSIYLSISIIYLHHLYTPSLPV